MPMPSIKHNVHQCDICEEYFCADCNSDYLPRCSSECDEIHKEQQIDAAREHNKNMISWANDRG